jgi:hypothetical protein
MNSALHAVEAACIFERDLFHIARLCLLRLYHVIVFAEHAQHKIDKRVRTEMQAAAAGRKYAIDQRFVKQQSTSARLCSKHVQLLAQSNGSEFAQ